MKKIKIITLGGTIAMKEDSQGRAIPALSGKELIECVPELVNIADISVEAFCNKPSGHLTLEDMFGVANRIRELAHNKEADGFVVVQGTDTQEETAYLLDITIGIEQPVVITGAMRNASEAGYDGVVNLLGACRVAADDEAYAKGVLLLCNEVILPARDVTKSHTSRVDTFCAPYEGPLGVVEKHKILFYRAPLIRETYMVKNSNAEVALVKMCADMKPYLLESCIENHVDGIIIEGFGRGQVSPSVVPSIEKAIQNGIPVILTSRCGRGCVLDTYGHEASADHLKRLGVIFGGDLTGVKARIKLIVVLGMTRDMSEIKKAFEKDIYE